MTGFRGWKVLRVGGEESRAKGRGPARRVRKQPGLERRGGASRAPEKTGEGMGVLCSEKEPGACGQPPTGSNLRQPGLLQLRAAEIQVKPA